MLTFIFYLHVALFGGVCDQHFLAGFRVAIDAQVNVDDTLLDCVSARKCDVVFGVLQLQTMMVDENFPRMLL